MLHKSETALQEKPGVAQRDTLAALTEAKRMVDLILTPETELVQDDREYFKLDGLEKYQLGQDLVRMRLSGNDTQHLLSAYRSMGKLPHGVTGDFFCDNLSSATSDFASKLVEFTKKHFPFVMHEIDLLINTTSVGMHPGDPLLIAPEILPPNIFIYDVVYNQKTPLLKLAEEKKLASLGGLDMLIYQGALSFEIWTGRKAPIRVMKEVLMEKFVK